jgi:hypothetical protein
LKSLQPAPLLNFIVRRAIVTALLYVVLAVTAVGVVLGLESFNRLVDVEFTQFHDRWLADGRPNGGRLSRAQASSWRSGFARHHVFHEWLTATPEWAQGNAEAEKLLRRFRAGTIIVVLTVLVFGGVVVLGT